MDNPQEKLLTIKKGKCGENVFYKLSNDGTLVISGKGSMDDYNITNYAPWHSDSKTIKKLIIENDVTRVGAYAFYDSTELTSVIMSDSVTSIGNNAFKKTQWLKNKQKENPLVIKNKILIDGTACSGNIVIPNGVVKIADSAFEYCENIAVVIIPPSIKYIGKYAFAGCDYLTDVIILDSVTAINDYAFRECIGLTNIQLGNNITAIGNSAFYSCINLRGLNIPNSVKGIGSWAFVDCVSLIGVKLPNKITNIFSCAFVDCISLKGIDIPNSIKSIADNAFHGCKKLADVNFCGTEEEWNKIYIDNNGNECLTKANIHFQCKSQQENYRFKEVTEQEAKILIKNGYKVNPKKDSYIVKYLMDDEPNVNTLLKSLNKNIKA